MGENLTGKCEEKDHQEALDINGITGNTRAIRKVTSVYFRQII
jgi:hypothetical protein